MRTDKITKKSKSQAALQVHRRQQEFSGPFFGVPTLGLGDNCMEWNIISFLFTNEKVACVDTENNELNRALK